MTKVCIELENGKKMFVELYEDIAPLSVKNFLKLVDEKFYDGIIFHRIIKKFITKENFYNMSLKEYIEFVKLLKKKEYSTHYRKKILTTVNNFMEEYYPEIYMEIYI